MSLCERENQFGSILSLWKEKEKEKAASPRQGPRGKKSSARSEAPAFCSAEGWKEKREKVTFLYH